MDRRPTLWVLGGALTCIALISASPAAAQDEAAKLRDEAKKLLAAGKTPEACEKLEAAVALGRKSEPMLELAQCHEKDNKTATAVAAYKEAATVARKERRYDREKTAKTRVYALEPKLPKLTITVSPEATGAEVTVDGEPLDKAQLGKPRPVDPGEHFVEATAAGKKSWEHTVTIAASEKKTVTVPALAPDKAGAAAAAPKSKPGAAKPADAAKPAANEKPAAAATADTADAAPPAGGKEHESGRLVAEIGAFGAFQFADFETSELDRVQGLTYQLRRPGGTELIVECVLETCEAHYESEIGLLVGGEAFLGYAVTSAVHLGVRGFGAVRIGGGWMLAGGPAVSFGVTDRLWLGASFLVGAVEHNATISQILADVPEELQELNGGATVPVNQTADTPTEHDVSSHFAFGGNLEISFVLVDLPELGSLRLAAWPMFLKGSNGLAIVVPGGLAFRFH
jgi:hypothetical protein